ncbi:unnamed protein product [Paramecium sonneborni]|uniref:Uncharacterized protein n=1 Tax=Paramecium sonneborni TaxID=65129 RepID=A0A8S1MKK0_9CILI|nr:unnamed protein product [Paramecium sonneborni]
MIKQSPDSINFEMNEQMSVFNYANKMKEKQKQQILEKLLNYNINTLNKGFQNFKLNAPKTIPFKKLVDCQNLDIRDDIIGFKTIAEGKLAIVISSQQNTGFLDIQLPSKKCLFQLYFERIQSLQNLTKNIQGNCIPILIFIMTTNFNHDIITSNLQNSNYYGLEEHQIYFFQQDCLPLLSIDGQILFRNENQIYEEHIGNGQIYLNKQILETMKLLGITILQLCSIENILCKFGDPFWLGAFTRLQLDLSFKCTQKRNSEEKLLIVVENDQSQLRLIENNEISIKQVSNSYGLIGQVLCSLDYALDLCKNYKSQMQTNLPMRQKKCTYFDYKLNQLIQPKLATSNALKFEITYYDSLPYCSIHKFGLFNVQRDDEYAPIINNLNDTKDTAQTARNAYLQRDLKWITQLGININLEIEISPKLTYFGEGLHEILQTINIQKANKKNQLILDQDSKQVKMLRVYSDHNQVQKNNYSKNLNIQLANFEKEFQQSLFQLPLELKKQTQRINLVQKQETLRDANYTENYQN